MTTKEHIIRQVVNDRRGKFFTVRFTKKDGSMRAMLCRTGVKKYLNPNAKKIKQSAEVQKVFDVHKRAYRSFRFDSVVKIGNVEFVNQ
jgi:hypothetical protein